MEYTINTFILKNPKARKEVFKSMDELNLKDIFREMYPTLIRYSW